jgi:hypothetical protein
LPEEVQERLKLADKGEFVSTPSFGRELIDSRDVTYEESIGCG